jgi:hypothetical protein
VGLRAFFRKARGESAAPEPLPLPAATAAGPAGWVRAGTRFDVHRMSKDELREMAYELLAGGAISMPDLRLLSLEPVTCASHWPDWKTFETAGGADGRRDWTEEIAARMRKGHPDRAYIGYLRLLLSFLMRVEAARPRMTQPVEPAFVGAPPSRPAQAPARPVSGRLASPLPST